MKFTLGAVLAVAALGATEIPQGQVRGPLEGVWKATEIVATGAKPSRIPSPQPNVYIFTPTYYSIVRVAGAEPRVLFKAPGPTEGEKLAAYDTFVATSGTYELSGTTLILRPVVAKNPNLMAGGFETFQVRVEGGTLWLTLKSTDVHVRRGDLIEPSPGPLTETRFKLIRVE